MSVAVITGAASGIGAGLAREAARRGMQVVLGDVDANALDTVAREIGDAAMAVRTDVSKASDLNALAERAYAAHGQVDLLFNNAGLLSTGLTWEISAERWKQIVDVNLIGVVNGIRAFVPRMIAANRPGRIINTSSVGGFLPAPLMSPYVATKAAVVALTESLAGDLKMLKTQIEVSLLSPGAVQTGIFRDTPTDTSRQFHELMISLVGDNGTAPDAFAAMVFDAVERGEYWIFPHPEAFDPGFEARNAIISARKPPEFYLMPEEE